MRLLITNWNFIILVSIFSALFIPSSYAISENKVKSKAEINIGIYAPFSNEHAFIGRTMLGTIEKARDQLNSSDINYVFYTLDQLPDNPNAANTLQKFIDAHQIKILLTQGTPGGLVAASIAKKNNIIHFSMTDEMTIADGKNNFLAWSPAYAKAVALVDELKQGNQATMTADPHSRTVLNHSVVKQLQTKSPIYNVFTLLNQGAVLALKNNSKCSSQQISKQIVALAAGKNVIGPIRLKSQDVLYSKTEKKDKVHTA